jgi:hypothetical protein
MWTMLSLIYRHYCRARLLEMRKEMRKEMREAGLGSLA